jgi:polyhydroxybutyrate depolymerase
MAECMVRMIITIIAMLGATPAVARQCALFPATGVQSITIITPDGRRDLTIFVPEQMNRGHSLPLIFDLHGSGSNGEQQAKVSGLRDLAATKGFIVASPDGATPLTGRPNGRAWNIPGVPLINGAPVPAGTPSDVDFIRAAIVQLTASGCVDSRRVYATGLSGGGRMSSYLGCALSDRIAAIAPVVGLRAGLPDKIDPTKPDPASCGPTRPVAVLAFHGTSDRVNPYLGGGTLYWRYDVPTALARWAALNGCANRPRSTRISAVVTRTTYGGCKQRGDVMLYLTEASEAGGGGHVWPKANGIDASALIVEFFARHVLRR